MTEPAVARVKAILVCASAGEPMRSLNESQVNSDTGLAGDRYALGLGLYSRVEPVKIRHLTFITQDAIDTANEWQQASGLPAFSAADARRNIVLEGISAQALNALVDQAFRVGSVSCRGVELATPCQRPSEVSGITGFADAFDGRGGLRAQACDSGVVRVGDLLTIG